MANKGAQTIDGIAAARTKTTSHVELDHGTLNSHTPSTPDPGLTQLSAPVSSITLTSSSSPTPPHPRSHPPPVHRQPDLQQPFNIHQRVRQPGQSPGGRTATSPSIRQSWFFPANRATPSTAMPETLSIITLTQRPSNLRSAVASSSSTTSSSTSASDISPSVPPTVASNHKERRNFSGSARSRLSKIDHLNRMTLIQNASAPSLLDVSAPGYSSPVSPRRSRLPDHTSTDPSSSSSNTSSSSSSSVSVDIAPKSKEQVAGAMPMASTNITTSYPRHIIVQSGTQSVIPDDLDATSESLSSSLPSANGFHTGMSTVESDSSVTKAEKANRHTSMPLPRPGWRLHDVPDTDEGDHDHDTADVEDEDRPGMLYSPSNASSTTNFEQHGHIHSYGHGRQDSANTFYTATPNASGLDLPLGSSPANLASIDSQIYPLSEAQSTPQSSSIGLSLSPSAFNLPPPVPKAIRNNSKSPLALRRSSTASSASGSSTSNTFLNRGSLPKSSLSSTTIHRTKTLTEERQKIILEILRTERSYVDGLVILQTLFYDPLNAPYAANNGFNGMGTMASQMSATGPYGTMSTTNTSMYYPSSTMGSNSTLASSTAPLLSKKSVAEIFSNFSEVLQINTLLLTRLETRICGATFSTGWESDNDEQEDGAALSDGDQAERDDSRVGHYEDEDHTERAPKQVLVTVGSQGGEQEELLVLDQEWCISDIFIEIAPFLKMYSNYVKNYTSALAHINDCMNRNERFTEFLRTQSRKPECKNLGFHSYLMLPIQRIPRYRMLLEGLLRHTSVDHPDHSKLQMAVESMEVTANFVNETIRQHEMIQEMLHLQSRVTGLPEPLVIPGRVLLKKGRVWKICRKNVQLREIFLFSDCILWTSPSLNPLVDESLAFHRKVSLENCTVISAEDPDPTKNAFQIISHEKSSQVYVDTLREKENWMSAIRKATADYLSAKRTLKIMITPLQSISAAATSFGAGLLRRDTGLWSPTLAFGEVRSRTFASNMCVDPEVDVVGAVAAAGGWSNGYEAGYGTSPPLNGQSKTQQPLRVVENYNAPVWVPDQSATRCMICLEEFSIIRRKHHCRVCGKVVCHTCSTRSIVMKGAHPSHSDKVGRACDDCIETMFPEEARANQAATPSQVPENAAIGVKASILDQEEQSNSPIAISDEAARRESYQSQDGVLVRSEDYHSDAIAATGGGATGMVRGFVEAGLSRMKSRSGPGSGNQDPAGTASDQASRDNARASNRRSFGAASNGASEGTKACGLCKTEFGLFKWKYVCQQCHRVVCADCLTKKQIDPLFLLGLQAEREARAAEEGHVNDLAIISSVSSPTTPSDTMESSSSFDSLTEDPMKPKLLQSVSDSAVLTSPVGNTSGGGWRGGSKGKTDSGLGQAERLCDPCYLGLSSDQVKVLESGGGWQYYQATLGKQASHEVAAALAMGQLSLDQAAAEDDA